jgi:hypothetical protein
MLNRKGADLVPDGIFGPKTQQAAVDFQERVHAGDLKGLAGEDTWPKLLQNTEVTIVDAVDVTDPMLETDADVWEKYGSHPLRTGGMCNGLESVIQRIIAQANGPDSIGLLRFDGHGNHGHWWTISVGEVVDLAKENSQEYKAVAKEWHSYIDTKHVDDLAAVLQPLKHYLAPYGSVEHHGCSIGGPNGRPLVRKLANLFGVPVTAGVGLQSVTPDPNVALRFDGPTFTAYPNNGTLRSWSRAVAQLVPQICQ